MIDKKRFKESLKKANKSIVGAVPILLSVVTIISMINVFVPKSFYTVFFSKTNTLLNVFIGNVLGSILAGNPITSYILGGEFLANGIPLIVVTVFIVSWVTVGLIQFPAEATLLGKKFAIVRNIVSFIISIFVALITIFIMEVLHVI